MDSTAEQCVSLIAPRAIPLSKEVFDEFDVTFVLFW